jgi:hypothetical protein
MKKIMLIFILLLIACPVSTDAEDFLGAPLIPDGKIIKKTGKRLEMKTDLSHEEALAYYREALIGLEDIKFRDWKTDTYIEDDGALAWHSITISKDDGQGTTIVIMKDSWTWIMGTLLLRYVGVFVVLLFLLVGMSLSGAIISRSVKKSEEKKD